MTIQEIMTMAVQKGASDIHVVEGAPLTLRINGELQPVVESPVQSAALTSELIMSALNPEQQEKLKKDKELDFSLAVAGVGRFRGNAYTQRQTFAMDLRVISEAIPSIDELRLPRICHTLATLRQGFVLVTGPTGHGKSTTIAAIIEEINQTRAANIVTIEDPIEYLYTNKKSIFSQRELGADTANWNASLKSVLRQDPDVVLIGEMRDLDTMMAALTIAETGHLVFSTLHTNSAAQTVDRIVDSFSGPQQAQVRLQLSNVIEAVVSQRLVPAKTGVRVPATEIMVATPAVRNTIREAKTPQLDNIIQTSSELGMSTLESSLAYWVGQGVIDIDKAREYSLRPAELNRLLSK